MIGPSIAVAIFLIGSMALVEMGLPLWQAILICAIAAFLFGAFFSSD